MTIKNNNTLSSSLYLVLVVIGIIYIANLIYFPGLFQTGDGLRHYQISRYSWKHPELLLHLWGKPFFTLISSPFSQFGITGIKIFNSVCALLSCICIYKIALKLDIKNPELAPLFLGFTNLYFFMVMSGYTELFFGLILVYCILLFVNKKYFWSTILISFLPFVRSEGYLLLPLFFLILILRRKYIYVFLLGTGNLIYSILGYFIFEDFFWLHSQNPYNGRMAEIYGHGPLLHFVNEYGLIWGRPLAILTVFGLLTALIRIFRKSDSENKYFSEEIIIVYGSLLVYFCAHSVFWWKGLFNSLGLERVIGAILPVSALVSLRGFNFILSAISKIKIPVFLIGIPIIVFVIAKPFYDSNFPLRLDREEQEILQVKKWYDNSEFKNHSYKIYYLHPSFPEALSFDAFNDSLSSELWGVFSVIKTWGYSSIPDSSIFLWDTHYAMNEGALPLESLMHNSHFRLIKSFYPKEPFVVLGNKPFEIHVFQKINLEDINKSKLLQIKYDLESSDGIENLNTLVQGHSFSGNYSSMLNDTIKFSATIKQNTKSIENIQNVKCIELDFKLSGKNEINAVAVLSLHKNDKQIAYYSSPLNHLFTKGEEWADVSFNWKIDPKQLNEAEFIKAYVLNNEKQKFYVDDFTLNFLINCK